MLYLLAISDIRTRNVVKMISVIDIPSTPNANFIPRGAIQSFPPGSFNMFSN